MLAAGLVAKQDQDMVLGKFGAEVFIEQFFLAIAKYLGIGHVKNQFYFGGHLVHVLPTGTTASYGLKGKFFDECCCVHWGKVRVFLGNGDKFVLFKSILYIIQKQI